MNDRYGRGRKGIYFLASVLVFAVAVWLFIEVMDRQNGPEPRAEMTEGFGKFEEKIFQGQTYYKKPNVTTMLLIGIDRTETENHISYRSGGQADFLLLLGIDHDDHKVFQLQIDRDTMTKIKVLTVLGQDGGEREQQICLSHAFGATQEECCLNTINAVSRYLDYLKIDFYMAVDYSAIALINDMLGGVTVTLEEDFSISDPTMVIGKTLTLNGSQAELYVRGRMTVGDGTNTARQRRQQAWLSGAVSLLRERTKSNINMFQQLLEALGENLVTNVSSGRLINEINAALQYEDSEVELIPGVHIIGSTGYVEFRTEPDDVTSWLVNHLYRAADEYGKERAQ